MDELVQWLGAQLDEDERIARAAGHERVAPTPWRGESWDDAVLDGDGLVDARGNGIAVVKGELVRDHIAEHDPARVLREIDAKRRMIARIRYHADLMGWDEVHGDLLRLLASVYDARPGFQESWRQ